MATRIPKHAGGPRRELRILLIGKTGVGKSSTANAILGENIFKASAIADSVTKACQYGVRKSYRDWESVLVVDTPGWFDTNMTKLECEEKISAFTGLTAPGPHVIIFILKVGERFTAEDEETVNVFQGMFGETVYDYMVVLFTSTDSLQRQNLKFDDYLKVIGGTVGNVIDQSGGRRVEFRNKHCQAKTTEDVERLFDIIDSMVNREVAYYNNSDFETIHQINRTLMEEIQLTGSYSEAEAMQILRDSYQNEGSFLRRLLQIIKENVLVRIIMDGVKNIFDSPLLRNMKNNG